MIVAVRENQLEVLKVLLEHSGDPNAIDQLGWRPLHHTVGADYEYPEAIRALVQHGASVDGRDGLQRTVLHRAAGFGHTESVRLLLALGADPSLREKYGNSAADRAEQAGHRNITQLIQAYQGTASESEVAEPNGSTITDITQRDPVEVILSILINWTYGLLPAALLRFLILRHPLGKTTAMWISAGGRFVPDCHSDGSCPPGRNQTKHGSRSRLDISHVHNTPCWVATRPQCYSRRRSARMMKLKIQPPTTGCRDGRQVGQVEDTGH